MNCALTGLKPHLRPWRNSSAMEPAVVPWLTVPNPHAQL